MDLGIRIGMILLIIVLVIFGTKKLAHIGADLGGRCGGYKDACARTATRPPTRARRRR